MNNSIENQLNDEITTGRNAQRAYDSFIKSFVLDKRAVLFTAFQDVSIVEAEALQEIKRQLIVLETLDQEILTIIETGDLAKKQLNK